MSDQNSDTTHYVCGNPQCKAQVTLADYKVRDVYTYLCENCGHRGVVPRYDYELWLKRRLICEI